MKYFVIYQLIELIITSAIIKIIVRSYVLNVIEVNDEIISHKIYIITYFYIINYYMISDQKRDILLNVFYGDPPITSIRGIYDKVKKTWHRIK